jgi:hypothetical protein
VSSLIPVVYVPFPRHAGHVTLSLIMEGMLGNFYGKLNYPQLVQKDLSDPNLTSLNYAGSQTFEGKYTTQLDQMLNTYSA